jgi:hypothetical protein
MKQNDWAGIISRIQALCLFAFSVVFFAYLERGMGPAPVAVYLAWVGIWSGILLPLVLVAFSRRLRLRFYALFLMCFAVIYSLPLSPCEPIVHDLARVRPGMTRAQAMKIMRPYLFVSGSGDRLCYRHDNTDGAHNADAAIVEFSPEDRVVRTYFLHD